MTEEEQKKYNIDSIPTGFIGSNFERPLQVYNPDIEKYPQSIWLDLAENNPDNSFKLYHSKGGLKDPFSICDISRLFHKNRKEK